jgi:hypothetical protein
MMNNNNNNNYQKQQKQECSSVLLCNANGINGRFKATLIQSLKAMQDEAKQLPLAICITESKLQTGFSPPNLSSFHYSSSNNFIRPWGAGGGITVYIHDDYGCSRRDELESKDVEIVWIELHKPLLHLHPDEPLLLGVVYRTPRDFPNRSQQSQWQKIKSNITNAISSFEQKGPVLVVGDWNLKSLAAATSSNDGFDSFIDEKYLHILAPPDDQSTFARAAPNSGANDFGICTVDTAVAAVEVTVGSGLSTDHFPVLFHLLSSPSAAEVEEERSVGNKEGDSMLFRELVKSSMEVMSAKLQLLTEKGDAADDSEYDEFAEQLSNNLRVAGLISYGKRTTKRAI